MLYRKILNRYLKDVSLQVVILVPFLLLAFIAVAVVGIISFRSGQEAVNDVADQLRTEINERISGHLTSFLAIPTRINHTNAGSMTRGTLDHRDQEALMRHFWEQVGIFDTVTSISFSNTEGGLANAGREGAEELLYVIYTENFLSGTFYKYATDENGFKTELLDVVPSFDGRTRSWYTDALERGTDTWSDPYVLFTGQDMNISLSRPVYGENGELMGVIAVNLFLSHLVDFLSSISVGQNGQSFILERSGGLIATSGGAELFKPSDGGGFDRISAMQSEDLLIVSAVDTLLQKHGDLDTVEEMSKFNFNYEDEVQLGQVMPFQDPGGLNWLIVTVIPESDFMGQIEANRRSTIILMIATLAVVALISIFITSRILHPISQLNQSALALADGRWSQSMKTDSRIKEISLLSNSFSSMADQLRQMVRGLTNEVFDRKKAEQGKAILNKQLEAKNRELENIIYITSHDLRSPLVNIDGYSRELVYNLEQIDRSIDRLSAEVDSALLEELQKPQQEMAEALQYIRSSTNRMDQLIKGLLKLSRTGRASLYVEELDMNQLVQEVEKSFEYQVRESGVELVIEQLPPCRGDATQLGQVFSNLFDNALKYLDSERPGRIRISGSIEGERSVYCVEDNGIGIAAGQAEKMFDIFERGDNSSDNGEGLGLTIVRQILTRMDGEVWVRSTPGEGSSFYVALPAPGQR